MSNINIDWNTQPMTDGKCTGNGCPIKKTCLMFTTEKFNEDYGYLIPPHAVPNKEMIAFPKKCINFKSNAPHKPALNQFTVED